MTEEVNPLLDDLWRLPGRSTRAIVDLDALTQNVEIIASTLTPGTALMAVVKANGYGHGSVMVAKTAIDAGASALGVATVGEGRQLRRAGIQVPVLVLGAADPSEFAAAIELGLGVEMGSAASLEAADHVARGLGRPIDVHLKLDTGMRRLGFVESELTRLAHLLSEFHHVAPVGLFSHFARADESDSGPVNAQFERFLSYRSHLAVLGVLPAVSHFANSAATLRSRMYDLEMVRVGIALYGLAPSHEVPLLDGMTPVLSVVSRVRRAFRLERCDEVSYGGTYRASTNEGAALVPIGYGDGYPRALSNRGWMRLDGREAPVRGRVTMDQTVVGAESWADEGTPVGVMGPIGRGPSLDEVAELAETITYEIATRMTLRLPRYYVQANQFVAVEDERGLQLV